MGRWRQSSEQAGSFAGRAAIPGGAGSGARKESVSSCLCEETMAVCTQLGWAPLTGNAEKW